MDAKSQFLQGVYFFEGRGLTKPFLLDPKLSYHVPPDKRSQLIYFRGGNSSAELIYLIFMRDNKPMRYFPLGAKAATHVQLAVVEDLLPDSHLDIFLAAPEKTAGSIILDIGMIEI
jgi:assimilatory nitrate reductase catalytic subunit